MLKKMMIMVMMVTMMKVQQARTQLTVIFKSSVIISVRLLQSVFFFSSLFSSSLIARLIPTHYRQGFTSRW